LPSKVERSLEGEIEKWVKYQSPTTRYELLALKLLNLKRSSSQRLLDCGAGNGRFSFHLVAIYKKLEAICLEPDSIMINEIKQRKKRLKDNLVYVVRATMQYLPFREQQFDSVLNVHNLWYVKEYKKTCLEMMKTCKGTVVMDQVNLIYPRNLILFVLHSLKSVILRVWGKHAYPLYYRTPRQTFQPFKKQGLKVFYPNPKLKLLSERFLLTYSSVTH